MKISEIRIDGRVMTKTGRIGRIITAHNNGAVHVMFGTGVANPMWASELEPVSDPRQSCEMAATITSQCKQIADLQGRLDEMTLRSNANCRKATTEFFRGRDLTNAQIKTTEEERDQWKATAQQYCRNAFYWREELTELQKEALAECQPLDEVAKIYVTTRIDASQMLAGIREVQGKLLSDDAKIVCELLDGSGPMTSSQIADRLHLLERCILESITESRDVGKIRLVNGKYEIVRD